MVSASEGIRLEVRFDDRLLTVLSQPAGDRHDAAVRWRQLVDLVARAGPESASPVVGRALDTIRSEAADIDEDLRVAAARAVAGRSLPIGLLEYLVSERLAVSAPVPGRRDAGRGAMACTASACRRRNASVYRDASTRRRVQADEGRTSADSCANASLRNEPRSRRCRTVRRALR